MRKRLGECLDLMAEYWIGLSFPPPARVVEETGWKPDAPELYCHRCGDSTATGEVTASGCGTCRPGAELAGGIGNSFIRLGPYTDALQSWILAIKYQRWTDMGRYLGRELGHAVFNSCAIDRKRTIIVPVPMPWQRRIFRGIDHTHVLAQGMAEALRIPVLRILRKDLHPPQVILAPSARRRSGSRGLHIRKRWGGWPLHDLHVILLDDVRTTGATLKGATRLLRSLKPAHITCAVLAVSDSKARRDRRHIPHPRNEHTQALACVQSPA